MSTRQNDVMRVQRAERADCTRDCAPSVGPTARLRSFVPFKPAVVVAVCHRGTLTFVRRLRVDAFYANRGGGGRCIVGERDGQRDQWERVVVQGCTRTLKRAREGGEVARLDVEFVMKGSGSEPQE